VPYKTKIPGIYLIFNKISGKFYIGSAVNIYQRWATHRSDLNKHKHDNQHLQNAWNKYGITEFQFTILEIVDDPKQLLTKEQWYLDQISSNTTGVYNICFTAGSCLGKTVSLETREKIRQGHLEKSLSQEHRQNISRALKGKNTGPRSPLSKEHRDSISRTHRGELSYSAKLTWPQVKEIRQRASLESQSALAREFGVTQSAIWRIINNKTWRE